MAEIKNPYTDTAKEIVKEALLDGQELRHFNNLFSEITNEIIGKEFNFQGTVFKTKREFLDFLINTLHWNKQLNGY